MSLNRIRINSDSISWISTMVISLHLLPRLLLSKIMLKTSPGENFSWNWYLSRCFNTYLSIKISSLCTSTLKLWALIFTPLELRSLIRSSLSLTTTTWWSSLEEWSLFKCSRCTKIPSSILVLTVSNTFKRVSSISMKTAVFYRNFTSTTSWDNRAMITFTNA